MTNQFLVSSNTTGDSFGTAFSINGFDVRWYGIFYALGILVAIVLIIIKLKTFYKVDDTPFYIYIFIAVPCILLGARAWSFVIGDAKTGTTGFFDFRGGGLAVQGGVIFTAIAGLIWFGIILGKPKYFVNTKDEVIHNGILSTEDNFRRISMWVFADTIIPAILIGQAIGRWGNFFNHEVYGDIVQTSISTGGNYYADPNGPAFTQWGWLKNFMPQVWNNMWISSGDSLDIPAFRVPIFLIESFMNVIVFLFIYYVIDFIKGYRSGTATFAYFLSTGIVRLVIEIFRDQQFKFETSIITSALFIVFGAIGIILCYVLFPKIRQYRIVYFLWINFWINTKAACVWFYDLFKHSKNSFKIYQKKFKQKSQPIKRQFNELFYYNDNIVEKPYIY